MAGKTAGRDSPERDFGMVRRLSCTKGSSAALTSIRGTYICSEKEHWCYTARSLPDRPLKQRGMFRAQFVGLEP